jgi:hypothetical protein
MSKQSTLFIIEDRYRYEESKLRQAVVDRDVAEFLRKGGKIQQLPMDATSYDRSGKQPEAFVINNHALPPKKSKQNWKEYRHDQK